MTEQATTLRAAIDELNKKPCTCLVCSMCRGTGEMPGDEFDTCVACHRGIVEMCERCMEMEELYQLLDDQEEKRRHDQQAN